MPSFLNWHERSEYQKLLVCTQGVPKFVPWNERSEVPQRQNACAEFHELVWATGEIPYVVGLRGAAEHARWHTNTFNFSRLYKIVGQTPAKRVRYECLSVYLSRIEGSPPKGVFNSGKTTIYSEMTAIRPLYIAITTLSNNIRYCFGYYFGIKNLLQ